MTYLGREKRGELQDTGHPRPESQMTARPFEFAYILLTLMFSIVACSEVVSSKWNVLLNLSRICNSAERDLKSVSFVFLGTDQRFIYWLNEFSNLPKVIKEGSLHSPARGILKLKLTHLSQRDTQGPNIMHLWKNKLSRVSALAEGPTHTSTLYFLYFFWTKSSWISDLAREENVYLCPCPLLV